MNVLIIPIEGKDTALELKELDVESLILDEMNPRIGYYKDNQPKEHLTQDEIIFALTQKKPEAFRKLKDSIHNNRGIVYPIWVEPIDDGHFKIIEGNTRTLIYLHLTIDEPNEDRWRKILSYVLPFKITEGQKNFIRLQSHLRGTTEWDAYEKAKYLYYLWYEDGWSVDRLEKQTKLSTIEIQNNIDAYKIMEQNYLPKYGDDPNEVSKFSYFVEYVKDKKLQRLVDKEENKINDFCNWVADEDKIPKGQDVRKLRDILATDDCRTVYLEHGFEEAIHILELRRPHLVSPLFSNIEKVIEGLKSISAEELDEMGDDENNEKRKLLNSMKDWTQKVLDMA